MSLCPMPLQSLFELLEGRARVEDCHMPSEFPLERRRFELLDVDQVHLLAESDVEPDAFVGEVLRDRVADVPSVFSRMWRSSRPHASAVSSGPGSWHIISRQQVAESANLR